MSGTVRWILGAVAVIALAALGWLSFQPLPRSSARTTEATLWTAGATLPSDIPRGLQLALPDAAGAPAEARRIPDVAYLRREFPLLQRLTIEGDGIDADAVPALQGIAITWRRPSTTTTRLPTWVAVAARRQLTVGERMRVEARVRSARPNEPLTVTLESPDGSKQSKDVTVTADGEAQCHLISDTPAAATGAFEWKLRLGTQGEALVIGAVVTRPELPRVLLLQSSPSVEGGRLQRWLAEAGAHVTSRTRVSADHMRVTTAKGGTTELTNLSAKTLADVDVIVAPEASLAELDENERAAVEAAVRDQGIGLLVIGESSGVSTSSLLLPWEMRMVENTGKEERRMTRLKLRDGSAISELASVVPAELTAAATVRWLVRDPQERTVVGAIPRGRGWVARSLVTDTWRWLQHGKPEIFATYWSHVLSSVARRAPSAGHWTLEPGSGPLFAGEPMRLVYVTATDTPLAAAEVRVASDDRAAPVPLKLTRDPSDAARTLAHYWPERSGWHEVRALPDGPCLAFHVQSSTALPELRAERRRDATERLVEGTGTSPAGGETLVAGPGSQTPSWPAYGWFAVFTATVGLIWWSERRWRVRAAK